MSWARKTFAFHVTAALYSHSNAHIRTHTHTRAPSNTYPYSPLAVNAVVFPKIHNNSKEGHIKFTA